MINTVSTLINAEATTEGFQGFNPITNADTLKMEALGLETGTAQYAKFIKTTVVSATDEDAGNGTSLVFEKNSLQTDKLYCLDPVLMADFTTALLADESVSVIIERKGSFNVLKSFGEEEGEEGL